ncbi:Midasin [Astathelohania contejeani]|uniref:Midasin n=1 Tax=Astathelohania contejeani TaxID=164912 RepID=A0ABQ7HYT4_9MICR|nr:Midasin [Thelohania contejeani]
MENKRIKRNMSIPFPNKYTHELNDMLRLEMVIGLYGTLGKTHFLQQYCDQIGQFLIKIDAREITEAKSLIGTYIIEEGDIVYKTGLLANAMKEGRWLLIKRIDQNPTLLSFVKPVIETRKIDGVNDTHPNFKIFFTTKETFHHRLVHFIGPFFFELETVLDYFFRQHKSTISNIIEKTGLLKPNQEIDRPTMLSLTRLKRRLDYGNVLKSDNLCHKERIVIFNAISNIFLSPLLLNERVQKEREIRELLYLSENDILRNANWGVIPGYALTTPIEYVVEDLCSNITHFEPTLLIGETGTGKTTIVEYLNKNAFELFKRTPKYKAINLSSDSDIADLIGCYQSVDIKKMIEENFPGINLKTNKKEKIIEEIKKYNGNSKIKENFIKIINQKTTFIYNEGVLVKAIKEGHWLLLDEINLAPEETLQFIDSVLASKSITVYERGEFRPIEFHPDFMLFACMNPSGDFGKKNYKGENFSKIYFSDFNDSLKDIKKVVSSYINDSDNISQLYYEIKSGIKNKDLVGHGMKPLITGRTLVRLLRMNTKVPLFDCFNLFVLSQLNLDSRSKAKDIYKKYYTIPIIKPFKTEIDLDYVITPRLGLHLKNIKLAIKNNIPVLLEGDTSTGKTSLISYLAKKFKKKLIRINNHEHTESGDYVGNYITTPEGVVFKEGPLITAMRMGNWVLLDELNLAPSDVLEVLNRLLDDNKELFIMETQEKVKAHPDFRLFGAQNQSRGKYGGRKGLSEAFRNRFVEIFFEVLPDSEIGEILALRSKLPNTFCRKMMSVYSELRLQRSIKCLMTLRDLFKWGGRCPTDFEELCVYGLMIVYEKQREKKDREFVLGVFGRVFTNISNILETYHNWCDKTWKTLLSSFSYNIVLTPSVKRMLVLLYQAWFNHEPVLLVGETGTGKTKICEILSSIFKLKLITLSMHSSIESNDFIGQFIINQGEIQWKDGPLTMALTQGNAFLIDEINLAEDSVLERLNSVFEDSRTLFITETGVDITAHDSFRVAATMNPGNDFGKRELSDALRNRFTEIYVVFEEYEMIFNGIVDQRVKCEVIREDLKSYYKEHPIYSLRKMELVIEYINYRCNNTITDSIDSICTNIICQAYQIIRPVKQTMTYYEDESYFGVSPHLLPNKFKVNYNFNTPTALINLSNISRVLGLERGIMLEGEPGVGKTSIVLALAKKMGIPVIRINLSDQTELSDLVGSYLPTPKGICFVESQFVCVLRNGGWIILDEVNLCTQSVIEGLNSVLDYRKRLIHPEGIVEVNNKTRIFATMNPPKDGNGRKGLPRSFLDRFVRIRMEEYSSEDIKLIINDEINESIIKNKGLRECIRVKELGMNYVLQEPVEYKIEGGILTVGGASLEGNDVNMNNFVFIHSQLQQIETFIQCINKAVPVILSGAIGKDSLIKFVSSFINLEMVKINCHKEMDISDLLGQYHKKGVDTFYWEDSSLVKAVEKGALIVLEEAHLVEKSIFDRLNPLFERERSLNVYERGMDSVVEVHPRTRFVIITDVDGVLSPALLDRCVKIRLSNKINYMDLWKIYNTSNTNIQNVCTGSNKSLNAFSNINMSETYTISMVDLRKWVLLQKAPSYLNLPLNGIYNCINENDINSMLNKIFKIEELNEAETKILSLFDSKWMEFYEKLNRASEIINWEEILNEKDKVIKTVSVLKLLIKGGWHSIEEMKVEFIKEIEGACVGDLPNLLERAKYIMLLESTVSYLENIEFNSDFYEFIKKCQSLGIDVRNLSSLRIKIQRIKIAKQIRNKIYNLYKYGHVCDLEEDRNEYNKLSLKKDKWEERDFMNLYSQLLQHNQRLEIMRLINEYKHGEFDDLLYYILLDNYVPLYPDLSQGYKLILKEDKNIISRENINIINEYKGNEFYKAIYQIYYGRSINKKDIIKEWILINNMNNDMTNDIIIDNAILNDIINEQLMYYSARFDSYIHILHDKPLSIKKESLINKEFVSINNNLIRDVILEGVLIDRKIDYKSFIYLLRGDIIMKELEEYILGGKTIEFIERLDFIEEYVRHNINNNHSLLYNMSLQYKSFGIQTKFVTLLKSSLKKYKKIKSMLGIESIDNLYRIYKKIKSELEKYINGYIVNMLGNVIINPISWDGVIGNIYPLSHTRTILEKIFNSLGRYTPEDRVRLLEDDRINFSNILDSMEREVNERYDNVVELYYSRMPNDIYSEDEILIAKIINYWDRISYTRLIGLAVYEGDKVFIYLLYKMMEGTKKYEDNKEEEIFGGEENVGNDISNGDMSNNSMSDEMSDNNMGFDSNHEDDISFDNEGSISTVEDSGSDINIEEDSIEEDMDDNNNMEDTNNIADNNVSDDNSMEDDISDNDISGDDNSSDNNSIEDNLSDDNSMGDNISDGMDDDINNMDDNKDININNTDMNDNMNTDRDDLHCNEYNQGEQSINTEQTCNIADNNYNSLVQGNNQDTVLAEGEGDELVSMDNNLGVLSYDGILKLGVGINLDLNALFDGIQIESARLAMQLRTILEPNRVCKYGGEYKSGKKLNLRRLVAYIASEYRRDRIWQRRIRRAKPNYIIRIFIDNSKSMFNISLIEALFRTLKLITEALGTLGLEYELYSFGSGVQRYEDVRELLKGLCFDSPTTSIDWISEFSDGINIVITDGIFQGMSIWQPNSLVLILDRCGVKQLSRVVVEDGNVIVGRYLDGLGIRYCVIEEADEVEEYFVMGLKELIKEIIN